MKKKRILITGGAGFLGSYLCERFLSEGYHVVVVDNLITGERRNILELEKNPFFTFKNHDINKPFRIEGNLDYILHFASPASPIDYNKLPIFTLKVGAWGSYNMLEMAREKKARILMASTSEVYGDAIIDNQDENYFGNVNPIGPRSVYDEAKRFQEAMTMAYYRTYNVETRIVRIFNTYGPRMRLNDGRALPTFIGQALKGENLTIFGDGKQTRSFCYVDDLIDGIYKLLFSTYHKPVNIGNPDEISILNFAREIAGLSEKKLEFKNFKLPENDPLKRRPNIALAKKILDWEPKISRKEGLKKTWNYFSQLTHLELEPRKFEIQ